VKELAESRNQADALVHSTRKSLTEYGDKLEAGEKEKIEAAITDLEASIKSGDKAEIDAKVQRCRPLRRSWARRCTPTCRRSKLPAVRRRGPGGEQAKPQDDVVDADFKEVKDSK
jgi:molecular chaperone DnaK